MISIGLDIMGGDREIKGDLGTDIRLKGAIDARDRESNLRVFVYGTQDAVDSIIAPNVSIGRITPIIIEADADSNESEANLCMKKMISDLKEGKIEGGVSAGDTGDLIVNSLELGRIKPEGKRKPFVTALTGFLPHISGRQTLMLDLGGTATGFNNMDHMLSTYLNNAILAIAHFKAHNNGKLPKIGLLNIGNESYKGPKGLQEVYKLFKEKFGDIFIGNIEGNEIFTTDADIIITDGFSGNLVLKTAEGTVRIFGGEVKKAFLGSTWGKVVGGLSKPFLNDVKKKYDPDLYSGAPVLGVDGILFKSHGSSSQEAITQAILKTYKDAKNGILDISKSHLKELVREYSV